MADDVELFHAWRAGDRAAGAELVARHEPALGRFFGSKVPDQADDLVQRTLLICAEATTTFRGEGSFKAFLFGIARNVLHEHLRSRARHGGRAIDFAQSSIMDLAPGAATIATKRAEHRVLAAALREIPIDLQLLLELYYWEEMGIDELAREFKVPAGTVKSRLHRARGLLADIIPRIGATPEETESARVELRAWDEGDGERPSEAAPTRDD
jgi:RNA polymerase sigma factor (sigma-70 family)